MPIYEYYCPECKSKFELLRSMSKADDDGDCPICQSTSKRVLSRFSAFSKGMSGLTTSLDSGGCSSCASSSCDTCQ
ncbi:MAG: zinc ribbon domain-containing protein [Chloroflexi bacterium]|nr:zinc ribbon domain-containing protein [Chloroflexota bacterium]MBT7080371.1 zinc ribbon domain-containing protein [Chloroflexota bacterium]MBT7289809.1 zinc ribbon domain-containing protein [Chloroflexota bacterium]